MWLDSVSPIKEVEKVNVPMLIIHSDVDQRTPPRAARKYMKALKESMIKIIKYYGLRVQIILVTHFSTIIRWNFIQL